MNQVPLPRAGCIALMALVGCQPASNVPATTPVRGTVTFNGEALTSGTVSFIPAQFNKGDFIRPVTAEIQPDGTFVASTFRPNDGIIPGEYKVSIVSYSVLPDPDTPGQEVWAVPRKYGDPQTSELTADIPEQREGILLEFPLEGDL